MCIRDRFPAGQPNLNDDFVGASPVPILPLVSPLENNGGPTPTRMLLLNSEAVDQGKCNIITADQRSHHNSANGLRAVDQPDVTDFLTPCDIGAVELDATSNNPLPVANDDEYTLLEGELLVVTTTEGLLDNDVDDEALVVLSAGIFDTTPTTVQGSVDLWANGAFSFTAFDADAFGSTDFSYTISDQFNTATGEVVLTVQPVNDAPFYTANQDQILAPVGQYLSYPQWAENLSPGPANESAQNLVFVVEILNAPTGYFAGFPTVDAQTGTLKFELAAPAIGLAELRMTLRDDGGTDNGGEDSYSTLLRILASDVIFATGFE